MIEVDLDAIQNNVSILKDRAGCGFMAVVKADAYGHGAVRVAEAAIEAGADWLGVANIAEGCVLRGAGIGEPILVFSEPEPTAKNITLMSYADLTPVVYTQEFIQLFAEHSSTGAEVHLKVDTGMHRVGSSPSEALDLAVSIREKGLKLEGVMTHLTCAETDMKETMMQLHRFDEVYGQITRQETMGHVLNTWGVLNNYPGSRYDMVRCGLGMYGLVGAEFGLKPALSLKSKISYVRWLPQHSYVGYNKSYKMKNSGYVGVVPVGYADGVPVSCSGEAWVAAEELMLPILAVFMDMMIVGLGRNPFSVGAEVELVGKEIKASDWCNWTGRNEYEVVCALGRCR